MVFFLAVSLLTAEGIIRLIEPKLSRDLAQIRNLPNVAAALRQHQGKTILVMGNSLTRQAVDTAMLTEGLKAKGVSNPGLFLFTPDGTNIANWDYGLGRYFLHQNALPDEVMMGTGPLHLRDSFGDASRLAAYYVDGVDLKRAWQEDLPEWEEKCEFLLSRLSVVHASRHRIKPHVFGRLIPHYFDIEQWINTQRDAARQRTGKAPVGHESHRHLATLLEACRQKGVKVRLFSIPLPEPYQTSAATLKAIQSGGAQWLSLSDIPGLSPAHFPDGYHLNADGAKIFTQRLVEALKASP